MGAPVVDEELERHVGSTPIAGGLLVDEAESAVFVAGEVGGGGFPAQIAIDALVIDVILAGHVVRILVRKHCHAREYSETALLGKCRQGWIWGLVLPGRVLGCGQGETHGVR